MNGVRRGHGGKVTRDAATVLAKDSQLDFTCGRFLGLLHEGSQDGNALLSGADAKRARDAGLADISAHRPRLRWDLRRCN
jgi:hypothetical protein